MRILLADDQTDAATPLRDFLKDTGHEVELVDSAEKALARVAEMPFDFVLMDQYFPPPGMDGIEVTKRICDVRPGQRVIILTAYGDLESSHRALDAGAYRYIFTPCEQETILAVMKSAQAVVELERALTQDSTLLRVLDQVGMGISVIDRSYRILYMNERQRAISRPSAKRGGICWMEFNQNLEAKPCPWCPSKPAMDHGETELRTTISMVEGKLHYYRVVTSPMKSENGEILAAVEFTRDITEQYEAEQKSLSSVSTDDRLEATLMLICSLGYGRVRLYELSEDGTILRGRAEYGGPPIPIQDIEILVEEDRYSKNTISFTSPTIYRKGQFGETQYDARLGRQDIEQWIDVPLLADGQCVGKIIVDSKNVFGQPPWRPKPSAEITDAHFPYIQLLAESAAREILRERQLRKMTADSKRLEKLRELAEAVASPFSDLHEDLDRIVETCVELIGVQGAYLRLLEDNALVLVAGKGPYYEMVKETRKALTVQWALSGSVRAWTSREEVIEPDARSDDSLQKQIKEVQDPRQQQTLESIQSLAYFPILFEGKCLGVLGLQSGRRAFFGPTAQNAVKDFVGMIGPIIKIARLLADLERAQQQLKMAARAAVHQANNPNYATQLLVTNWLKMQAEGKATLESASAVMKATSDNSTRIANLGKRLRRFLKGPEIIESRQAVELEGVVQQVVQGFLPEDAGYVLRVTAEPDTPAVHVDRLVLAEVFGEIAANARKAMKAGGTCTVSIRRARREEIVEENLAEGGEYARIEVRDSGPGIAQDKKKWVFEPFHRDFSDGTGLGLSVLRDTLKMMGGTVREAGDPGEGAKFVLIIPVYPTERRERT